MDVSRSWQAHDWLNRGGELLDHDPWLAKRVLGRGLQFEPNEAIGWFNLGIGLHQQRRIAAAVRAYRHCLALLTSEETEQAAHNNLAQDLLLLGGGKRDGNTTPTVSLENQETIRCFTAPSDIATRAPNKTRATCTAYERTRLRRHLQFSRYAYIFKTRDLM